MLLCVLCGFTRFEIPGRGDAARRGGLRFYHLDSKNNAFADRFLAYIAGEQVSGYAGRPIW